VLFADRQILYMRKTCKEFFQLFFFIYMFLLIWYFCCIISGIREWKCAMARAFF